MYNKNYLTQAFTSTSSIFWILEFRYTCLSNILSNTLSYTQRLTNPVLKLWAQFFRDRIPNIRCRNFTSIFMVENSSLKILFVALRARRHVYIKSLSNDVGINVHDGSHDLPSPPFSFLFSKGATLRRNKKGYQRVNIRRKISQPLK